MPNKRFNNNDLHGSVEQNILLNIYIYEWSLKLNNSYKIVEFIPT